MDLKRHDRARFASELRRRGTMLSDEAIADVCEAYLELADDGSISLELHEQVLQRLRGRLAEAAAENGRLENIRLQGVAMGQAANRRIAELEAEVNRLKKLAGAP